MWTYVINCSEMVLWTYDIFAIWRAGHSGVVGVNPTYSPVKLIVQVGCSHIRPGASLPPQKSKNNFQELRYITLKLRTPSVILKRPWISMKLETPSTAARESGNHRRLPAVQLVHAGRNFVRGVKETSHTRKKTLLLKKKVWRFEMLKRWE